MVDFSNATAKIESVASATQETLSLRDLWCTEITITAQSEKTR